MENNNLIAYSMSFASYLVQSIKSDKIKNIILFGSVARGDHNKESDIDIFVDSKQNIEKEVYGVLDSFYDSIIYKKYWKLIGIRNEISIKVGNIENWDLKSSIISHGILLYGKYYHEMEGKLHSLFIIEIPGKRKDKIKVWRKLYGYKQKVNKKLYTQKGILEELQGKRLGASNFTVPIQNANQIKQFLRKNKVTFKSIDLQSDSL